MHTDETTMADIFSSSGYATGIFGKWHLGDNYPHRPQDRGFNHTLWHKSGGVGQASDEWGNDYFDDIYEENGTLKKFKGYCTDVWFEGALSFIKNKRKQDKPFFAYLPTNSPHSPHIVDPADAAPYKEIATWGKDTAKYYGQIANIDDNVGILRTKLKEWNLEEYTIMIFMSDNGASKSSLMIAPDELPKPDHGFNAELRGRKASMYDGGHRVPFFISWPAGGIGGGKDIRTLVAGYDILPTMINLCKLNKTEVAFDGVSLVPLLKGSSFSCKQRLFCPCCAQTRDS